MEKIDSEKLIIELNYKNEIVDEKLKDNVVSTRKMLDLLPETVVDKRTLEVVEIHELFKAIDHTATHAGSARLFHSLMNPSENIELIHAKQDAFWELEGNRKLQKAIQDFLEEFNRGEVALFKLLNAHMHPLLAHEDYRNAVKTIEKMLASVENLPRVETVYLDSLIKSIMSFNGSPVREIIGGEAHRTTRGIMSLEERGLFIPSLRFKPRRLGIGALLPSFPGLYFGAAWLFGFMDPIIAKTLFLGTSWFGATGFVYGFLVKPMIDYETAILPIRKRLQDSNRFATAIEGVAAIDELLSFVRFSEKMEHPTVMPEITNEENHFFVAKDLRNPINALGNKDFVGNDVNLARDRILFITGPNSGGKTTFCKTIVQNQILGQIGAPVVASAAMMNMADRITYQAPSFDSLSDPEGRFGTELKVTRDIFFSVTPKSLVILDEIAEGTTSAEKMSFSAEIMKGFQAIGNNTILVTHSHELVENFRREKQGQYLQVEFNGEIPTHKIIPGICKNSQAQRVAKKIGFSPEDIYAYLTRMGYLNDDQSD
jgi:DNA mismatch repair ATPase MutS